MRKSSITKLTLQPEEKYKNL